LLASGTNAPTFARQATGSSDGINDSLAQIVTLTGSGMSGAFTLTYNGQTTGDITVGSTPAQVQSALTTAVTGFTSSNVQVYGSTTASGGAYLILFTGNLANTSPVGSFTAQSSSGNPLFGGSVGTSVALPGGLTG